ncbi:MAG: hypothetical protein ICV84_24425, partial [Flavisolibacter sp.]|nr:hypothetical protein [Flavisolibacter sp.]
QQKENKGGRPTKYKEQYAKQAYELCLLGVTDAQLATYFEVNEDTIHEWKKCHPKFSESVKRGKLQADGKVAAALYKRALGFRYDEITWEKIELKLDDQSFSEDEIKTEAYKRKVVTKMVVPDTGAAMNWLKNRQRELWRDSEIDFDSLTDEQLDKLLDRIMVRSLKNNP